MTTRANLRQLSRIRLGDSASPTNWSDLQINQWINDAIAEYSTHFPRQLEAAINCSDDQRQYDLPEGFRAALSVEYPTGEDPPAYLSRRPHTHPDFWRQDGCYDIIRSRGATYPSEIWISSKPGTGEEISLRYLAEHAYLDDDSDTVTVPDRHLELVVLFVRWASYQELASTESADPDPTNLSLGTLELNASRARREYRVMLETLKAAESESASAIWSMDQYDKVY